MNNNKIQLNSLESNVPVGYTPIKLLAEQYNYAVNHVAWLARTKRIDAIQRGNKGQWLVQDVSIKKYYEMTLGTAVPKGYLPLKTLATKSGYAKNYLASLAKTGKIEALQDERGQWFASERSVSQYMTDATVRREESTQRGQSLLSSPNIQPDQTPPPVLLYESSSNAEGSPSRRNTAITVLALVGGILISGFLYFAPMGLELIPAQQKVASIFNIMRDGFFFSKEIGGEGTSVSPAAIITTESLYPLPITTPRPTATTPLVPHITQLKQITIQRNLSDSELADLKAQLLADAQLSLNPITSQLVLLANEVSNLQRTSARTGQAPLPRDLNSTQYPSAVAFSAGTFSGPLTVQDTLTVTKAFTVGSTALTTDFKVFGTASISGNLTVGNSLTVGNGITVGGSGTIGNQFAITGSASIGGRLQLTKEPTGAHTGTWPSFSNANEASLYLELIDPIADGNVLAYTSNGSTKFVIDAEGDIFGRSLVLSGTTTQGTTQVTADLTVEGNTQLGDASSDTIKIIGLIVPKTLTSASAIIQASASQTSDIFKIRDSNANSLLTIDQLGATIVSSSFNAGGGIASAAYSRFGNSATTHSFSLVKDLLISGKFEVDDQAFFDANASVSGNFEVDGKLMGNSTGSNSFAGSLDVTKGLRANAITGSGTLTISGTSNLAALNLTGNLALGNNNITGINALSATTINAFTLGGAITANANNITGVGQLTASLASISTNFEVGGYASIGGNVLTRGILTSSSTGSNSFAGSLDVTKGLRAANFTQVGTGTSYFNGNVGVGTTGPTSILDLRAAGGVSKLTSTTGTNAVYGQYTNNSGYMLVGMEGSVGNSQFTGTLPYSGFVTVSGERALQFATSNQVRMTIASTSFVGIGTTNPSQLLELSSSSPIIKLTDTDNDDWIINANGGNFVINNVQNGDRVTIESGGDVGIGTTNPGQKLHIEGASASSVAQTIRNTQAGTGALASFRMGNDLAINRLEMFTFSSTYTAAGAYQPDGSSILNEGTGGLSLGGVHATGVLRFYTGGAGDANERMRILSGGNVGIGTTGPNDKLEVYGGNIRIRQTINGSNGLISFTDTAGTVLFNQYYYNGLMSFNDQMVIKQSNGNVGIGTTDPGSYKLNVNGNIKSQDITVQQGAGNVIGGLSWTSTDSGQMYLNSGGVTKINLIATSGNSYINAGNVGIGTTVPTNVLTVKGGTLTVGTQASYALAAGNSNGNDVTIGSDASYVYVQSWNSKPLQFNNAGNNVIFNNSNVGIGTTGPGSRLEVENTAAADDVLLLEDSSGLCEAQPTTTGLTWSCSSDERLKTNIVVPSAVLAYITAIPLKNYTVIKTGENVMGPIAQELLLTNPELVRMGDDGYYQVSELSPWQIVKAIQELSSIVASQSQQFSSLYYGTNLAIGEIASFNPNTQAGVQKSTAEQDPIGVVTAIDPNGLQFTVTQTGAGQVRVSDEQGVIKAGDRLTVSPTQPGLAVKATRPGAVIGMALEDYHSATSTTGMISASINVSFWAPRASMLPASASLSETMMLQTTEGEGFSLASLFNFILNQFQKIGVLFKDGSIEATKIKGVQVCAGETCVNEDQLKALLQNGGAVSTPTPTPEPTPDSTPDSNSTPTPELGLEPTASPTPEVIPSPTPEPTPTPAPTPNDPPAPAPTP